MFSGFWALIIMSEQQMASSRIVASLARSNFSCFAGCLTRGGNYPNRRRRSRRSSQEMGNRNGREVMSEEAKGTGDSERAVRARRLVLYAKLARRIAGETYQGRLRP